VCFSTPVPYIDESSYDMMRITELRMKTRGLGFLAKNTCINKPIQTVKNYRDEPRYQIDYMLSHVVSGKTLRR